MKNGKKLISKESIPSHENRLIWVCRLLNQARAQYVVIGAWAANLHGLIRATVDIDILIPRNLGNTRKILEALQGLTFGIAKELEAEEIWQKPITFIGDIPRVDLLTIAGRVTFEHAKNKAIVSRIDGVKIHYADIDTLIESKKTGRLQDKADVERLKKIKAKSSLTHLPN